MNSDLPDFVRRRMEVVYLRRVREDWGGQHLFRGRHPGPRAIRLDTNDYLDLTAAPELAAAHATAASMRDRGTLMSAVFQQGGPQERLEVDFAAFLGHPAVMLCQSGFAANTGLLQSVASPGVPVYLDMMAHASFREGILSARADAVAFRHNDVEDLCNQIRQRGPGLVVADSVYSTHGTLCPLATLTRAAAEMGCFVVIDESHALGTHGSHGEGLVASLKLQPWVHAVTASLSKAFAGRGGLVACDPVLAEYLRFTSVPAIFSSALQQQDLAHLEAALALIRNADAQRIRLHSNARRIRSGLHELGYFVSSGTEQIIALEPGREPLALTLYNALAAHEIFGAIFCPPATARNRAILRLSVHCGLSEEDLHHILAACAEIRDEVKLSEWRSTRKWKGLETPSVLSAPPVREGAATGGVAR